MTILEQALSPHELEQFLGLVERGYLSNPANGYKMDVDDAERYAIEAAQQALEAVMKFSWQRESLGLPPEPDPDREPDEYGPYTSCGACGGNGCDRCMPHIYGDESEEET